MVILVVFHVIIALFLILAILLQSGKGNDIGAIFGGGASQTLFGATGGKALIVKITWGLLVVFFLTSLGLATLSPSRPKSPLQEKLKKEASQQPVPANTPQVPAEQNIPQQPQGSTQPPAGK